LFRVSRTCRISLPTAPVAPTIPTEYSNDVDEGPQVVVRSGTNAETGDIVASADRRTSDVNLMVFLLLGNNITDMQLVCAPSGVTAMMGTA
jgi:hypothetical protein